MNVDKKIVFDCSRLFINFDLTKFYGYPIIKCSNNIHPDFLSLYKETNMYNVTNNTCVCFYEYDIDFDNKKGLYNSIIYNDDKRLTFYKNRFKNVKYIITPDYTLSPDFPLCENQNRIYKSRLVGAWLKENTNAIVILNLTYGDIDSFKYCFDGLEHEKTIAFSTKGILNDKRLFNISKEAIKYVTDHYNIGTIIVYCCDGNMKKTLDLLQYAIDNKINIVIPNNTLLERNRKLQSINI